MSTLAPTREADRIDTLDVLRGLGVLGILAVNAVGFALPWEAAANPLNAPFPFEGLSAEVWRIVHVFFEQKFITLFAMLFGVSLFLVGGERDDAARTSLLRWRLFWLLVIGIIHGAVIWYGDILAFYAIAGFIASFCRSWRPWKLLLVGGAAWLLAAAFEAGSAMMLAVLPMPPAEFEQLQREMNWTVSPADISTSIAAFGGTFDSSLSANFAAWLEMVGAVVFLPKTLGLMLIGLGLFKAGYLRGEAPAWVHAILVALGGAALALMNQQAMQAMNAGFPMIESLGQWRVALAFGSLFVTLGYASALMLLLRAVGTARLWWLAATGRMAFTNYLTQSLIMTVIFYGGRGLGLFGQMDRPELALVVVWVWALQLLWSPLWLSMFRMGPLEWLWRCLAYGRFLPILRTAAA